MGRFSLLEAYSLMALCMRERRQLATLAYEILAHFHQFLDRVTVGFIIIDYHISISGSLVIITASTSSKVQLSTRVC
eukprot:SAG11_NODE_747_length_7366_cov_7.215632_2_plen_77_part_00